MPGIKSTIHLLFFPSLLLLSVYFYLLPVLSFTFKSLPVNHMLGFLVFWISCMSLSPFSIPSSFTIISHSLIHLYNSLRSVSLLLSFPSSLFSIITLSVCFRAERGKTQHINYFILEIYLSSFSFTFIFYFHLIIFVSFLSPLVVRIVILDSREDAMASIIKR